MKHVKSLALCLLALALVLALAGCGGGKSDLPGTYKIDLDLAPALNSAMTQLGLAEEDLADLTLPVPYTLTLGEDGTYSMQADKEATVTALHTYLQGCGSAIEAALYKTAEESGLSREDFDAAFEQSTGSSVSDYVAEQISQLDEESLLSSLEEDEESGVYKAADGKLYFEEQEADFSEEDYVSYTLEGGKLTFTSVTGDAMGDLKGALETLIKRLYGEDAIVRFRPHHFPFTEPSCEVDMQCFKCHGTGETAGQVCSTCHGEGWIELLGAGMVHPKVLEGCGIDPKKYSGFAFGIGLERMAMGRLRINDLRLIFDNDVRFLSQF